MFFDGFLLKITEVILKFKVFFRTTAIMAAVAAVLSGAFGQATLAKQLAIASIGVAITPCVFWHLIVFSCIVRLQRQTSTMEFSNIKNVIVQNQFKSFGPSK